MTVWQALLLGLVQGLTEFLPISSSGHLVLVQRLLEIQSPVFTFDIWIHFATLLVIVIYFGRSLFTVSKHEWWLVAIGTVPAVIAGFLFKDFFEQLFEHDAWLGVELIISGLINFYIVWRLKQVPVDEEIETPLTPVKSMMVGLAQAVAIIPAISRSGATVAGAVGVGMSREKAFRFSFLLALPALLGASVLQLLEIRKTGLGELDVLVLLVGGVAAFISGWLSIRLFKYVINHAQLHWFGWYCLILGVGVWLFLT